MNMMNTISGAAGQAASRPTEREPQVIRAVRELDGAASNLIDEIESIEVRLQSVLTPAPPAPHTKPGAEVREVMCSHAEHLLMLSDRLRSQIVRLNNLRDRIETP